MSIVLYNIFLALYRTAARIVSPFNTKAAQWVAGRNNVWNELAQLQRGKRRIWVHCSSLGEYEQALPLIEALQKNAEIIVTFFSPSGYTVVKKKQPDGNIFYLPNDSKANAKRFVDAIAPTLVVFVRYDLWYYYLKELQSRQVPTILISAVFRKESIFFRWYGSIFREMLRCFTHIFVQDDGSKEVLQQHGFRDVTVAGDTRIDRVAGIPATAPRFPLIEKFKGNSKVFMVGSLEPNDERVVMPAIRNLLSQKVKCVIAPHQVSKRHVSDLARKLDGKVVLHSGSSADIIDQYDILIIDSIGMLSGLYRYADVVYIGGGFGEGLHNLLEPAAWGKPVLFGPQHARFTEAQALLNAGGGFVVGDAGDLSLHLGRLLADDGLCRKASEAGRQFVINNQGGASAIHRWISENKNVEK